MSKEGGGGLGRRVKQWKKALQIAPSAFWIAKFMFSMRDSRRENQSFNIYSRDVDIGNEDR